MATKIRYDSVPFNERTAAKVPRVTELKDNILSVANPELAKEWHPTLNGDLTPYSMTCSSHKKVWWLGKCGHEWQAVISSRNKGCDCPYCSNKKVLKGYNDFATANPDLAFEWHPTLNGNLTPDDVTRNSNKKVWWLGKCGHEWQTSVYKRSKGSDCPFCSGRMVLEGFNDLTTVNPELASEWHPTLNGDLTPNDVTRSSCKTVWWFGKCGHEWQAIIYSRSNGNGCPYCSNKKVLKGYNDLATTNPELAAEWHPTLNGILTPDMVTAGGEKKVRWLGKCGHEWQETIYGRSKGNGCPYCSGHRVLKGYNDLGTTNPELASEWHPTLNGDLTPNMVMAGSGKKVWWLGKCGHEWQATINSRNNGSGCPACWQESQTSFAEQSIYYYVKKSFPGAANRDMSSGKELDIYIPSIKTGIEYDGYFYHNNINRDKQKILWCKKHGIRLIRVREERCPKISGDDIIIRHGQNDASLNNVLIQVMQLLEVDDCLIDINKDRADIYEQYIELKKYNSLTHANPILASEWHPTKNKNLKPNMVTNSSNKKVWWLGKCGHEWQATISDRANGKGCPFCSGRMVLKGFNDLITVNPELASEWHPALNGKLKSSDVTRSSNKKVWWLCKQGHEWQASVNNRSKGNGCPYCSNQKVLKGYNDLVTVNPQLASEWHPTLNGDLTPHDVTRSSGRKIWWLGKCGHEWQAAIYIRGNGIGCPYCANKKAMKGYNDLETTNPKLASEWHPTLNGDLTPNAVTRGSGKKVWWKCKQGHEWQAVISNRNKGRGCPYCSGRKRIIPKTDTTEK